jgi:hypothetical protein
MAMDSGMQNSMMQAGIQGAQHTNDQELAQRQALFQNLVSAMDDSSWINQHFPQFSSWVPSGGSSQGYQPGSNAPMIAPRGNFQMAQGSNPGQNNNQQAQADYYKYLIEKDKKLGSPDNSGNPSNTQNSYSNLWS